jgi:hypothetical protein
MEGRAATGLDQRSGGTAIYNRDRSPHQKSKAFRIEESTPEWRGRRLEACTFFDLPAKSRERVVRS